MPEHRAKPLGLFSKMAEPRRVGVLLMPFNLAACDFIGLGDFVLRYLRHNNIMKVLAIVSGASTFEPEGAHLLFLSLAGALLVSRMYMIYGMHTITLR